MTRRKAFLAAAAVLVVGTAAAFLLVEGDPATAAEALARAEKKLDRFSRMTGLSEADARREQDAVLDRFRFSVKKWPEAAQTRTAARRIAELLHTWQRFAEAFDAFKSLDTADGLWTAAEIAERDLKQDAMALWTEFATKYKDDPRADDAAWHVIELMVAAGRDRFAPGDLMDACARFCAAFPKSDLRVKALLLRADTLRGVKETDAALREYDKIIEEFEGNAAAAKALMEKGKILAEQDKPREAKEAFDELDRKFPGSEESRGSGGMREDTEKKLAEKESLDKEKDFFKDHFGLPGGDLAGAASPRDTPAKYFGLLVQQRIDIRTFDIDGTIDPSAKTLTATGRMTLKNEGASRTSVYFQIAPGFKLTKASSGGKDLVVTQEETRLLVALKIDKDAEAAIDFAWTGIESGPNAPLRLGEEGYAAPGAVWYPTTYIGDTHSGKLTLHAPGDVRVSDSTRPALGLFFAYSKAKPATNGRFTYLGAHATLLDIAADVVGFYEPHFGPLPTATLTFVDADLPEFVGGISPQGLIYLNRAFMASGRDITSLLAHELAHQWWGNLVPVTVGRDDYTPWLSEGLASQADAMYLEHRFGPERARQHLEKGAQIYIQRTAKLADDPLLKCWAGHPEYPAVVYLKGAVVAEMLRAELGPSYGAGLRRWAKECAHRESGLADFRAAMEAESKRDLKDWFRQWIESDGFPRLKVSVEGTTLVIRQESKTFALLVDIEIDGVVKPFTLAKSEERIELGKTPSKIVLDPKGRILKRPGPGNEWSK